MPSVPEAIVLEVPGSRGGPGPQGAPGVQGPPGVQGAAGPDGSAGASNRKVGRVPAAGFLGTPRRYAVTFTEPFETTPAPFALAEVSSGAHHSVNVVDVTETGFTLELADTDLAGLVAVWWTANEVTETYVAPVIPDPSTDLSVFFLGHSLLNDEVPNIVQRFADSLDGVSLLRDVAIGLGAPLALQWSDQSGTIGANPITSLNAGPYTVLVLTEATPIENHIGGSNSVENALNFMRLAYAQNPLVQVYLYETWEARTVADGWRSSIDSRRTYYEQIVAGIRAEFDGADIRIIPGGQALGALVDEVTAGNVPDLTDPEELFQDAQHLTPLGNYFLGCVHFAALYQQSPVGRPAAILDSFGNPYAVVPTPAMATAMQGLAWRVVQAEPYSGVPAEAGVPVVTARAPASVATGVDTAGAIVATFDEAMDPATIDAASFVLMRDGVLVASTVRYAGNQATLQPTAPLADSSLYTAVVTTAARDASGVPLAARHAWSFTTGSSAPVPTVNYTFPADDATGVFPWNAIDVVFNDAMDPATINSLTLTVSTGGAPVPGTVVYTPGTLTARFTPDVGWGNGLDYGVSLAGAMSEAGGALPLFEFSFTSRAITQPTVIAESPAADATNVAVNTAIEATFSEVLNDTTIDETTFLVSAGGVPVAGVVTYANPVATFTPAADLAAGTTYTVRLTNDIWSGAGQQMAAEHTWGFTTV